MKEKLPNESLTNPAMKEDRRFGTHRTTDTKANSRLDLCREHTSLQESLIAIRGFCLACRHIIAEDTQNLVWCYLTNTMSQAVRYQLPISIAYGVIDGVHWRWAWIGYDTSIFRRASSDADPMPPYYMIPLHQLMHWTGLSMLVRTLADICLS